MPLSGCTVETDDMLGGERIVSDLSAVDISKAGLIPCMSVTDNGSITCKRVGTNHPHSVHRIHTLASLDD